MRHLLIRQFSELCLHVAEGREEQAWRNLESNGPIDLEALSARAEEHRVTNLLAGVLNEASANLRNKTQTPSSVVKTPVHHLSQSLMLKGQILELDRALKGKKSNVVLLKGAIQLFEPLYPQQGMRRMADIDILVDDVGPFEALVSLGYRNREGVADPTIPKLPIGEHHYPPLLREKDLATVELHKVAVSPMYSRIVPEGFMQDSVEIEGCSNVKIPSPRHYLAHTLVHCLKHDRDTLDGGLLLRGLVECELLFARLNDEDVEAVRKHFFDQKSGKLWEAWRALSDWAFRSDDKAFYRSVPAFLLILEFRIRATGYRSVFLIAFFNRLASVVTPKYWTSGKGVRANRLVMTGDFWGRLYSKFLRALSR